MSLKETGPTPECHTRNGCVLNKTLRTGQALRIAEWQEPIPRKRSTLFLQAHVGSVKQPQALLEVCSQLCFGGISEPCDVRFKVLTDSIHKFPSVKQNSDYLLLPSRGHLDPNDWLTVTEHEPLPRNSRVEESTSSVFVHG